MMTRMTNACDDNNNDNDSTGDRYFFISMIDTHSIECSAFPRENFVSIASVLNQWFIQLF